MKQAYFTSKTIEAQAQSFLDQVKRKKIANLGERKMALLGLDLQEYFLNPDSHAFVPSAPAIIPNVTALTQAFQAGGLPVIYTQHLNQPENAGMMAEWWQDLITPGHPRAGLSPELGLDGADVIQKTQYDAFYQTDLADRLRAQDVEDLVICGVMTHLCCETTARSAFVRGFRVWFMVDATASYNAEFHLGALRNLAHGFVSPVLTAEVLSAL
ncbi:MAG: isochorismatase family protein [Chloroflexota bacterium]